MLGARQTVAAGLLFALGLLLIWIGFSGRLGLMLGALLCPAQLVEPGDVSIGDREGIDPSITRSFTSTPGGHENFK